MKYYRLAIDDGVFFLRDIAQKKYRSIFDCPFLNDLRTLQTRIVINIFFETPDADFNLTQMPATYRSEWAANADWLRLAFHARREFPDRPYAHSSPAEILRDYDDTAREVLRFAGEATFSPTTVVHWATTQANALPALATRGVRALSGLFYREATGHWDLHYGLDAKLCATAYKDGLVRDPASGILVSRFDIVINNTPIEKIPATLERATAGSSPEHVVDLLTHEQYSWPFYHNYVPDHTERMRTAIRWCTDRGCQSVYLNEV